MLRNIRRSTVGLLGVAALVMSGLLSTPVAATATPNGSPIEEIADESSRITTVSINFAEPQTLADAAQIRNANGYPIVAYRFENPEIVGEFSIHGPSSVEDYSKAFFDSYGTQPQVVAAVVEMTVGEAKSVAADTLRSDATVKGVGPEYVAPPVDLSRIDALLATSRSKRQNTNTPPEAARAASNWRPTDADIQVFRVSPVMVYFSQYYYWDGVTAKTSVLGSDDGWEGEINIRTNHPDFQAGARGGLACPGGYKDRPFAKNYNWNWAALVNTTGGLNTMAAAVGAYADYNDLQDPCNQSSIAIGVRNPQLIPSYPNGSQEVLLNIQAMPGQDETGRIGGVVQAVNEVGCNLQPWLRLTDCMGTTISNAGYRPTLNWDRNWTAPNRCWMSPNYGSGSITSYPC